MKTSHCHVTVCVLAVIVLISLPGGCGTTESVISQWQAGAVVIDGDAGDWRTGPASTGGHGLDISVRNDSEYLYLCITAIEPAVRMWVLRTGFTVWFDRTGGSEKIFGINYPLKGGRRMGRPMTERPAGDDSGYGRGDREFPPTTLDVLGPGESDRYRLSTVESGGIQAMIGVTPEKGLVYELRVPLRPSSEHRFALGLDGVGPIGIGLETGEPDRESMRRPSMGPGVDGSSMPRRGRGGASGPGIEPGRGRTDRNRSGSPEKERQPDPVDFWFQATLERDPHQPH